MSITTEIPEERVDQQIEEFIHFNLHLNDSKREAEIRKAVHYFSRLENYRFVHERRKISLSDHLGYVELYSASELKESSGRSIRPQNIIDANGAKDVIFILTDQGVIKEQLQQKK